MRLKNLAFLTLFIFSGHAAVDDYETYKRIGERCVSLLKSAGRRDTKFPKEEFLSLVSEICTWKYNGEIVASGLAAVEKTLTGNVKTAGGAWSVILCEQFVDPKKPACILNFTVMGNQILPHIVNVSLWLNKGSGKVDLIDEVRGVVSKNSLHGPPKKSFIKKSSTKKKKKGLARMFGGLSHQKTV